MLRTIKKITPPFIKTIIKNCLFKRKKNISKSAIINDLAHVKISDLATIKDYVIIRSTVNDVIISDYTTINPFTVIYGGSGVIIGKYVMIAPHCMIASGNHNYLDTEKPMCNSGNLTKGPIIIEDDVWIGANCTIIDGVTIEQGAVVAANSLVNKNVRAYDIVGGVPAKFIRNRKDFTKE